MRNISILSLLFFFSFPSFCWAESEIKINSSDLYEPNISNYYQGRLIYNPIIEDYPIDKMIKLCKPYTGIDTAQTKCEELNQQKMIVCEYKCSMHWMIKKE